MAGPTDSGAIDFLFGVLTAYRILFYLGGLLAMSVPLLVEWASDATVPRSVRNAIVGVSFAVIVLTYVAERRVGLDHVDPATGAPREPYSRRTRVSFVLAIAGLAVGVYLVALGNAAMGLLFLAGALLFFQLAYRADRDGGETPTEVEEPTDDEGTRG